MQVRRAAITALLIVAAAAVVAAQSMLLPASHDEDQFVVAGWLLGEHGLLPYRDFTFHHLPNLVLLYAVTAVLGGRLLVLARGVSALLSVGTLILVGLITHRWMFGRSEWERWAAAVVAPLTLMLTPLFGYTSGRAWNHDLPVFLTLLAFWMQLTALKRPAARWTFAISGALLGLAVGARATFLPALVPFAAVQLFRVETDTVDPGQTEGHKLRNWWRVAQDRTRGRAAGAATFAAGFFISLLPAAVLAGLGSNGFLYGAAIYPRLNTEYRAALQHPGAMSALSKLLLFWEDVLADPTHLLLAAVFLMLAAAAVQRKRLSLGHEFWFSLSVAAALAVGAWIPSPSWYQYFYDPLVFVVLSAAALLVETVRSTSGIKLYVVAAVLVALLIGMRWELFARVPKLANPQSWIPVRLHRFGSELASAVGEGRVLTLAPLVAAEGGLDIYHQFSTGPFDWRVSPLLAPERRRQYGVAGPADLENLLRQQPPQAVLVGFERGNDGFTLNDPGQVEKPLEQYAAQHGYLPRSLQGPLDAGPLTLWLRGDGTGATQ